MLPRTKVPQVQVPSPETHAILQISTPFKHKWKENSLTPFLPQVDTRREVIQYNSLNLFEIIWFENFLI